MWLWKALRDRSGFQPYNLTRQSEQSYDSPESGLWWRNHFECCSITPPWGYWRVKWTNNLDLFCVFYQEIQKRYNLKLSSPNDRADNNKNSMWFALRRNVLYFMVLKSLVKLLYVWVFPKWKRHSVNSENLVNHWSMNLDQFKDPLCYLCLGGTVPSSLSLTQEVAGSSHWIQWKLFRGKLHCIFSCEIIQIHHSFEWWIRKFTPIDTYSPRACEENLTLSTRSRSICLLLYLLYKQEAHGFEPISDQHLVTWHGLLWILMSHVCLSQWVA